MEFRTHKVSPSHLLLDPNNYRFHDLSGYKRVSQRERYAEPGVQERALQLLQTTESFELPALRDSILTNGFVPIEQIVVEKFAEATAENDKPFYLVIEGNRRVASVKILLQDQAAGAANIKADVLATLQQLPVVEIDGAKAERESYRQTLMASPRVGGG
jgi:hypothetical protein